MEKRIVVDAIDRQLDGVRQVKLALQIVEGKDIVHSQWHRFTILLNVDLAQLREGLEAQLTNPASGIPNAPWLVISDAEWGKLL